MTRIGFASRLLSFSLLLLIAGPLAAQTGPALLSSEFRVDDAPSRWQLTPFAARADANTTAVFWDEDLEGIFIRRLDADGVAQGPDQMLVRSAGIHGPYRGLAYVRRQPTAQFLPGGDFVLAWTEERISLSTSAFYEERNVIDRDVLLQRFHADGEAADRRYRLDAGQQGFQTDARLALLPDGRLIAVWRNVDREQPTNNGIYARALDGAGVPHDASLRLDQGVDGEPGAPALAVAASGAVLVAWDGCCDDGGDAGIFARVLDAALSPAGDAVAVNATGAYPEVRPAAVATGNGDFLVAWQAKTGVMESIYGQRRVRGQLVTSDGTLLGDERVLSDGAGWAHDRPSLAVTSEGNILLSWLVFIGDFPTGIAATQLDDSGARVGDAEWVSASRILVANPASSAAADGRFLVTWIGVLDDQRAVAGRVVGTVE